MAHIIINGRKKLSGELQLQGSKNAALPVMAAALLIPGVTILKNCPNISDVECMCQILRTTGAKVDREADRVIIDASEITGHSLPEEYVTRMRSSVMLMGAMLGRCGCIDLSYPGGCVIGDRPIDMHKKALEKMGVICQDEGTMMKAFCTGLNGTEIVLPFPSVGATENVILAAVCAKGTTKLYHSAKEPEIEVLCEFLIKAGARIWGQGTSCITIEGVSDLRETEFSIPADRIVAGTYLLGVLAAGGEAFLKKAPCNHMQAVLDVVKDMGAYLRQEEDGLWVGSTGALKTPGRITTQVYPGFPTDLQSPLLPVLSTAKGDCLVTEAIFNGRFRVVEELNRMGAGILTAGNTAYVPGSKMLYGKDVTAEELRGGAALVIAGLCAEGRTRIYNRHFIDRGYEDICRDFQKLGAEIDSET